MKIALRGRQRDRGETVIADSEIISTEQGGIRPRFSAPVARDGKGVKIRFTTDTFSSGSSHRSTITLSKAELLELVRVAIG